MNRLLVAVLIALSGGAASASECANSEPRPLDLDLTGIERVEFDLGGSTLRLHAGASPSVRAKACSSHADQLDKIQLVQSRNGSTLVIRAESKAEWSGIFFATTYGYLDIDATLPAGLPLDLQVGSGEADVVGIEAVMADVGSGDLKVRDARSLKLDVGSGDAEVENVAGSVEVEVGSGDAQIRGAGDIANAEVGSGDLEIENVRGDVHIDSIGSGDLTVRTVDGSVSAGKIGSGDLVTRDVKGDLSVRRIGSGDVSHSGVGGRVDLPEDR
ncbi:MAG: DUF4097 family beta strand repeat protein [Xanthomonadales bacterium]|nr:DUF4097 family beta strand repeat protein [Xanthomonadales bacterium]